MSPGSVSRCVGPRISPGPSPRPPAVHTCVPSGVNARNCRLPPSSTTTTLVERRVPPRTWWNNCTSGPSRDPRTRAGSASIFQMVSLRAVPRPMSNWSASSLDDVSPGPAQPQTIRNRRLMQHLATPSRLLQCISKQVLRKGISQGIRNPPVPHDSLLAIKELHRLPIRIELQPGILADQRDERAGRLFRSQILSGSLQPAYPIVSRDPTSVGSAKEAVQFQGLQGAGDWPSGQADGYDSRAGIARTFPAPNPS